MSKSKRKQKSEPSLTISCRVCGISISDYFARYSGDLCRACSRRLTSQHQSYIQNYAVVIAELIVGFTTDLFSSELVIDAEGCYIHQVRWTDPVNHQPHNGEQLHCYEPQEWADILNEAKALYPYYRPSTSVMDDIERLQIRFRADELAHEQFLSMQSWANWQCDDGAERFGRLWTKIHQRSPWHQRLGC